MKSLRWRAITKAKKRQKTKFKLPTAVDVGFAMLKFPRGGHDLGA